MISDYPEKKDLTELVTMFEYLTPSYSLDFLTLVIIAAGLPNHQMQSGCKKAYELEIFKLLKEKWTLFIKLNNKKSRN